MVGPISAEIETTFAIHSRSHDRADGAIWETQCAPVSASFRQFSEWLSQTEDSKDDAGCTGDRQCPFSAHGTPETVWAYASYKRAPELMSAAPEMLVRNTRTDNIAQCFSAAVLSYSADRITMVFPNLRPI